MYLCARIWRLLSFALLCSSILLPLIAEAASDPVWSCPSLPPRDRELYIVPSSRIFDDSGKFRDQKYCCPENSYIDEQGRCGTYSCSNIDDESSAERNSAGTSRQDSTANRFTECPDVPAEFMSVRVLNDYYGAFDGYYFSRAKMFRYTSGHFCCPSNAICVRTENVTVTTVDQENSEILQRMFTCVVSYDTDGHLVAPEKVLTSSPIRLRAQLVNTKFDIREDPVPAVDISQHCDSKPCGARGVCTPTRDSYTCLCPTANPGGQNNGFTKECQYMFKRYETMETVRSICSGAFTCDPILDNPALKSAEIIGIQAFPCPAGFFGCSGMNGLADFESKPCIQPGVYCPPATQVPLPCEKGFWCKDSVTKIPCPNGFSCEEGSLFPRRCPQGSICPSQEAALRGMGKQQLVPRATPRIVCDKLDQAVTCSEGSSAPIALPAGRCGSSVSSKDCESGFYCPQLCRIPQRCKLGNFCPDGKHLVTCPPGHECTTEQLAQPEECVAGTYQPLSGFSYIWLRATLSPGKAICHRKCEKWHWNSPGATSCDSLSMWAIIFIVGMVILVPMVLLGVYFFVKKWWPLLRALYRTAKEDFDQDWYARTQTVQQELVQRIVRKVMLMPISVQSSRMIASSSASNPSSSSSPSFSIAHGSNVEVTPERNLSLLSEYRSFLSRLFHENLLDPECPSIIWLLCQYPHLSVIDLHMHIAAGIKAEVMEQFHVFASVTMKVLEKYDSSEQPEEGDNSTPDAEIWEATSDLRNTLKLEFFLYADSWIQLKRATNTSIQDQCSLLGGVHFPTGENRHKPPRLPSKQILKCVGLSLALSCWGSFSAANQAIRARVGGLSTLERPGGHVAAGSASEIELASASVDAAVSIVMPASSDNPPSINDEHLPSVNQFQQALDSDAAAAEEKAANRSNQLTSQPVDAHIEPSDDL